MAWAGARSPWARSAWPQVAAVAASHDGVMKIMGSPGVTMEMTHQELPICLGLCSPAHTERSWTPQLAGAALNFLLPGGRLVLEGSGVRSRDWRLHRLPRRPPPSHLTPTSLHLLLCLPALSYLLLIQGETGLLETSLQSG